MEVEGLLQSATYKEIPYQPVKIDLARIYII